MDKGLAARLNEQSTNYESSLYRKLCKLAGEYILAGTSVLDYYIPDFDVANDMANCFAPSEKTDFEKRERGSPQNFMHPMAQTEVTTLTTFVSQILFGGETSRKVEPRNPEDEPKADVVNQLLAWNDNQQPTYVQGYHWIWDAIVFNRGVMFDHWQTMMKVELEEVQEEVPYEPGLDERGRRIRKPKNYEPEITTRWRKKRTKIGGFSKIEAISPYDFICDPVLPMSRFQEGRFAGHRVLIPWKELKRRSELPVDDFQYVLPAVVERLKNSKGKKPAIRSNTGSANCTSRSFFERQKRGGTAISMTGSDKINKEDGGVIECFSVLVRARPATYDIFKDDQEEEIIEFLISQEAELLSVNVMTNKHDEYPYAVGEARPNAHAQFSPSWAIIIKGPQDYVEYLKNRHMESLSRTSGNIFIGNPTYVDFQAFTDPKKDGLFIPITEAGSGKPIDQIIKQVPIVDTTANFHSEMEMWQNVAETATGAHAATQGVTENANQTATQYAGDSQMATGRISTIARLLSASALCPQTRRMICDMQQFLPDEMTIRITGEGDAFDPENPPEKFTTVLRDKSAFEPGSEAVPANGDQPAQDAVARDPRADAMDIQGEFDIVVHDGSLPGADQKKVAALSRVIEAFSDPLLAPLIFDDTQPGCISIKRTFMKAAKATGLPINGLIITKEEAQKNAAAKLQAQGGGLGLPTSANGQQSQQTQPVPMEPTGAGNIPSASQLPPTPTAEPPQIRPQNA